MKYRTFATALFVILLMLVAPGFLYAADCATCSRNLTDCQKPAHSNYVSCMNTKAKDTSCTNKCAGDCQGKKEVQKCTLDCTRSCQGGGLCQATFTTASTQCINAYKTCRNGCTAAR